MLRRSLADDLARRVLRRIEASAPEPSSAPPPPHIAARRRLALERRADRRPVPQIESQRSRRSHARRSSASSPPTARNLTSSPTRRADSGLVLGSIRSRADRRSGLRSRRHAGAFAAPRAVSLRVHDARAARCTRDGCRRRHRRGMRRLLPASAARGRAPRGSAASAASPTWTSGATASVKAPHGAGSPATGRQRAVGSSTAASSTPRRVRPSASGAGSARRPGSGTGSDPEPHPSQSFVGLGVLP